MLFRFEYGKTYLWIFWSIAAVFAAGFVADGIVSSSISLWALLLAILYVVISSLRSGVTLDSSWSANVLKSETPGMFYLLLVVETSVAFVLAFTQIRG